MANERVAPMVDRQRARTSEAEDLARRQQPTRDRGTLERLTMAVGLDRADERIATTSTMVATGDGPRAHFRQRTGIPPEGNAPRPFALCRRRSQAQVRVRRVDHDL